MNLTMKQAQPPSEPRVVFLFETAVRRTGLECDVHVATGGDMAIARLRALIPGPFRRRGTRAPRMIFLDLEMPRCGGLEVLAWMRRHEIDIPVVVLSGTHESAALVAARQLGACAVARKPVDLATLGTVIAAALRTCLPRAA